MKWYNDTEIEEEWAFDKRKNKMVLRKRTIKKHGETKLESSVCSIISSRKIKKDKTDE
jgi:hypothetical protein